MRNVRGKLAGYYVARGALLAPLPMWVWWAVKAAPRSFLCDCPDELGHRLGRRS